MEPMRIGSRSGHHATSRSSARPTTAASSDGSRPAGPSDVDAAVAAAPAVRGRAAARTAAGRDPRRPRPTRSRERHEEFARIIADEAAKPIKTARVEADRAVGTFRVRRRRGPHARRRDGPDRRAPTPATGKLGFTLRVPIGVVGAISPFNFPLNLVAHKVAPAIAAGCPVVLKPASPDAVDRAIALAELLLDECGLPAGLPQRGHRRRRHRRQRARRPPRRRAASRSPARPRSAGASRRRAPRKKVGLELGNNAPVIIEPDGDWTTAADEDRRSPASATPASPASRRSASTCTSRSRDEFIDALVAAGRGARRR